MLFTIFSVDELDRDERHISLFSCNAMTRVSNLETTFTEGQLANERRGTLFSNTIVIENATPTFFLLLIHSDNPETEFARGDRYNCVFSDNPITRVNNAETVFFNEQRG